MPARASSLCNHHRWENADKLHVLRVLLGVCIRGIPVPSGSWIKVMYQDKSGYIAFKRPSSEFSFVQAVVLWCSSLSVTNSDPSE
eukprot:6492651-Amphidinium_carterae.5